jgi:adenylate kinase family enzyme
MACSTFPYSRLVIIGATGSGKSTLAQTLAGKCGLEYIELDALYWQPNWTATPRDVLREKVERATRTPRWVVAGNYGMARDILWPRAEAVFWLDYPLATVFRQLLSRTWRRWRTQEELWNGNRERLFPQFKLWSDESLFTWLLKSHGRHKREYPEALARPEYRHLQVLHFETPAATATWLDKNFGDRM